MKNKTLFLILITLLSIIALTLVEPIIPPFFALTTAWKAVYVTLVYGFPLLMVIPIALFLAPFALVFKRKSSFKTTWFKFTENVFLAFAILVFCANSLLFMSKYVLDLDPFPLVKYADLEGYAGDIEDLKTGTFESFSAEIRRYKDHQVEYTSPTDSTVLGLDWISPNEYLLVGPKGVYATDTLQVKITNNTPEFYECYVRSGEYATYFKLTKKLGPK